MPYNAYIHIPFCKSRCKYCSFVSFVSTGLIDEYINALLKDIKTNYEGEILNTLYFGGGTPSLLGRETVSKIFNCFNLSKNAEITFELNPDDADFEYLENLRNIGINRLSIGAQTFDNNILSAVGRRHSAESIIKAVKNAKKAGFENISLDLIYGLPEQTEEILKNDIENLLSLDINHISTYGLKIEQPSYFSKYMPENLPDDDKQADMYIMINNLLEGSGFKRYEISNFAHEGYESKHNTNYWNNAEYYGFGAAAHGYKNGVRYSNSTNLETYIKNPLTKVSEHFLSQKERLEEEIFLGFRKTEGINTFDIQKKYGVDFWKKYGTVLEKYMPEYLEKTENGFKLTLKGTLLSNIILSEFV